MLKIILHLLCSAFRSRQSLALENLALRHQLYVLQRPRSRIRLKKRDRVVWVVRSRIWRDWRSPLTIVQPDTVVRWHLPPPIETEPLVHAPRKETTVPDLADVPEEPPLETSRAFSPE